MSREKIAFIINPTSGRRRKKNLEDFLFQQLDDKKYKVFVFNTEYAGHARVLVAEAVAKGCKKVVAVGGDGTVNEVASAIIKYDAEMGILPTGSGNGLARHLGIPLRLNKAIDIVKYGNSKRIDAGKLNQKWFFCTCGIGFDARIGHKFNKLKKRGFISYIRMVLGEFRQYSPKKYTFYIDDKKYVRRAFLITIANAAQYGNNAYIAPNAAIDDGLFDICILKPFPWLKALSISRRLFNRSLEKSYYIEIIRGTQILFKKPKKKYIFHYDGEPAKFKGEKVKISMHPLRLKVLVP